MGMIMARRMGGMNAQDLRNFVMNRENNADGRMTFKFQGGTKIEA